jgi:hypothetical protein
VCAGLFLLALSYHLGARNATAQGEVIGPVGFDQYARPFLVIGRVIYRMGDDGLPAVYPAEPVPGTAAILGVDDAVAVLADGSVYRVDVLFDPGHWKLFGSFPVGATPTQRATWGAVKARYR